MRKPSIWAAFLLEDLAFKASLDYKEKKMVPGRIEVQLG